MYSEFLYCMRCADGKHQACNKQARSLIYFSNLLFKFLNKWWLPHSTSFKFQVHSTACVVRLKTGLCAYLCLPRSAVGRTSNLLIFNFISFKIARAISASVKDGMTRLLSSSSNRVPYQQQQQQQRGYSGSYHSKVGAACKLPGQRPMRYVQSDLHTCTYVCMHRTLELERKGIV